MFDHCYDKTVVWKGENSDGKHNEKRLWYTSLIRQESKQLVGLSAVDNLTWIKPDLYFKHCWVRFVPRRKILQFITNVEKCACERVLTQLQKIILCLIVVYSKIQVNLMQISFKSRIEFFLDPLCFECRLLPIGTEANIIQERICTNSQITYEVIDFPIWFAVCILRFVASRKDNI